METVEDQEEEIGVASVEVEVVHLAVVVEVSRLQQLLVLLSYMKVMPLQRSSSTRPRSVQRALAKAICSRWIRRPGR